MFNKVSFIFIIYIQVSDLKAIETGSPITTIIPNNQYILQQSLSFSIVKFFSTSLVLRTIGGLDKFIGYLLTAYRFFTKEIVESLNYGIW